MELNNNGVEGITMESARNAQPEKKPKDEEYTQTREETLLLQKTTQYQTHSGLRC